jgi:hypothetical protein
MAETRADEHRDEPDQRGLQRDSCRIGGGDVNGTERQLQSAEDHRQRGDERQRRGDGDQRAPEQFGRRVQDALVHWPLHITLGHCHT